MYKIHIENIAIVYSIHNIGRLLKVGIFLRGGSNPGNHGFCRRHRRRIKIEKKTKVVADVWGTELVQFLAALAIPPR